MTAKWSESLFKKLDLKDLLSKNKIINNLNEVQVGEIGCRHAERASSSRDEFIFQNYCRHGYDRCALWWSRGFK